MSKPAKKKFICQIQIAVIYIFQWKFTSFLDAHDLHTIQQRSVKCRQGRHQLSICQNDGRADINKTVRFLSFQTEKMKLRSFWPFMMQLTQMRINTSIGRITLYFNRHHSHRRTDIGLQRSLEKSIANSSQGKNKQKKTHAREFKIAGPISGTTQKYKCEMAFSHQVLISQSLGI